MNIDNYIQLGSTLIMLISLLVGFYIIYKDAGKIRLETITQAVIKTSSEIRNRDMIEKELIC